MLSVDCPKCDGKMVPLSTYENDLVKSSLPAEYALVSIPFYEWQCVKCGYSVRKTS